MSNLEKFENKYKELMKLLLMFTNLTFCHIYFIIIYIYIYFFFPWTGWELVAFFMPF